MSVLALDIDAASVAEARKVIKGLPSVSVELADATNLELDEPADVVVLLDVLEHVEDDVAFLRHLGNLLAPGGQMVIKVPSIPSLHNTLDEAVGHFRRYDRKALASALNRGGFDSPQIWAFNAVGIIGWWVNGRLLKRVHPPEDHISAFDRLIPVLRKVEQVCRPPIGLSLFAVASKPGSWPQ